MPKRQDVMLVDGNNVLAACVFATEGGGHRLTNNSGLPTGGVFAFTRKIRNLIDHVTADRVIVAWDGGKSSYRTSLFPAYKEQRKAQREKAGKNAEATYRSLIAQLGVANEFIPHLGLTSVMAGGYEADDLLYTFSKKLQPHQTGWVVSSDHDLWQLAGDGVNVISPSTKTEITQDNFEEVVGVRKESYVLMRAMVGDKSDNIDGVVGVGNKTAQKIVKAFPTFERLKKARAKKLIGIDRRAEAIRPSLDVIERNMKLMDLSLVPGGTPNNLEITPGAYNRSEIMSWCGNLGFDTILENAFSFLEPFARLNRR